MLKCVFETDDGRSIGLGVDSEIAFDIDVGAGVPVSIGTSQGFSQIGTTVETQGVEGRTLQIKGVAYGNVTQKKKMLRSIFSPFTSGTLKINNKYHSRVFVKNSPTFSTQKNDGRFTMQLYSPIPYFMLSEKTSYSFGETTKLFEFPVNYDLLHKFGETSIEKYVNFFNPGDVPVWFEIHVIVNTSLIELVFENVETGQRLIIKDPSGTPLYTGEQLKIYRDSNGMFKIEKTTGGSVEDVTGWLDLGSDLFKLNVGDNLIKAEDGGADSIGFSATLGFNSGYWSVFEE